ncbi:hypothetical protein F0L68_20895 [Solihabitans fulvus]|uniref:KOW motif-containing protein n=1 Tax=Solihabitans fulvus TaxID=1892852 RepID=A0A5B2X7Z8_9PSEU|nr:hypothetical protein [Solihabitans fulvus]KAA2259404.1 hypothetical protein F0L68_20895 [Solihabitans fulvus]
MTKDREDRPIVIGDEVHVIDGDFIGGGGTVHRVYDDTVGIRFEPHGPIVWLPMDHVNRIAP